MLILQILLLLAIYIPVAGAQDYHPGPGIPASGGTFTGPFFTNTGATTITSGNCGATTNGTVAGDNMSGKITIGAATTATCQVNFSGTLNQAPRAVMLTPGNAAAAGLGAGAPYVSALSSSSFTFSATALASEVWYYHVY